MKQRILSACTALTVLLLLWQLGSVALDKPFLPPPLDALRAFGHAWREGALPMHLAVSAWRVTAALVAACIPAAVLGLAMGQFSLLDHMLAPLLYLLYPLPKVVFLPILVVLFGLGDAPKIVLIALVLFFQLLMVTRDACRNVPHEYLLSARALGMKPVQCLYHVLLPACLPHIVTALRVGLGTAIAILFFSETFASLSGIGYYISDALSRRAYDRMFAGILAMSLLGLLFYLVLRAIEHRVSRWTKPH